ncbi:MAG: hypothetical protein AABY84_01770 [Candidatus Firestonebacteria bacterium]
MKNFDKNIFLNGKLIYLLIADIIISIFSWSLAIYLYNIFGEKTLTFEVLTRHSYIILIVSGVLGYILTLGGFRVVSLKKMQDVFLYKSRILIAIILYCSIIVLFFCFTPPHSIRAWIVLLVYLTSISVFTFIWHKWGKYIYQLFCVTFLEQDFKRYVPPILFERFPKGKENSGKIFIGIFIVLILFCTLLLMFQNKELADYVDDYAYFSLVIGVGIELYRGRKHSK